MSKLMARCPKSAGHKGEPYDGTFETTADVVQGWRVDAYGEFIETTEECVDVLHRPEKENFFCAVEECGENAEWFDLDGPKTTALDPADFEISRELVLSTGHITQLDSELLASEVVLSNPDLIVHEHSEYGWRVNISPRPAEYFEEIRTRLAEAPEANRYSESFWKCIEAARALGVNWVRFDRDGEVHLTGGLDVHEW